jgi:3-hydroxybutyryl-CoA dehydrogenase
MTALQSLAVLGAGTMGAAIAEICLLAGLHVQLFDPQPVALSKAKATIAANMAKLLAKGKYSQAVITAALEKLRLVNDLHLITDVGLVIEAVPEDLALKQQLFASLEQQFPTAIFATNTSTLSIASIFAALSQPQRGVGLHFFNPAQVIGLVEVIASVFTDQAVLTEIIAFAESLGKRVVVAKDTPGFIVNRIARPFYGEALRLLAAGAAITTIDQIMRGAGFRMGPFELMDFIGLDVNLASSKSVYQAFFHDPKYRPSPIQQQLVDARLLGRKTGRGFYHYNDEQTLPAPKKALLPKQPIINASNPHPLLVQWLTLQGIAVGESVPTAVPEPVLPTLPTLPTMYCCHNAASTLLAAQTLAPGLGFCLLPPLGPTTILEVMRPLQMSAEVFAEQCQQLQQLGLAFLVVPDAPAGVGLRIIACMINEAFALLAEGVADAATIDQAMQLATHYPHGPLAWAETIGLARVLAVLEGLFAYYGEDCYRPQPLLKKIVAAAVSVTAAATTTTALGASA